MCVDDSYVDGIVDRWLHICRGYSSRWFVSLPPSLRGKHLAMFSSIIANASKHYQEYQYGRVSDDNGIRCVDYLLICILVISKRCESRVICSRNSSAYLLVNSPLDV